MTRNTHKKVIMREQDKYVLAVDLGTSGVKTALISVYGELAVSSFAETKYYLFSDGGAEQNPQEWWRAVDHTVKDVLGRNVVAAENIVAVCATAQWAGTVAVDDEGNALTNAIIWMDSRGAEALKEIFKGLIKIHGYPFFRLLKWMRLTGGAPGYAGKDPLCHILWLKKNHPEIYRQTHKFLEPKDYLNLCFTGKFAATFDSILLHWVTDNRNPSKVVYSDTLLKMTGIDRVKLPELLRATDILGPLKDILADEWGLKRGLPVIAGTPDMPCTSIGAGAVRDYEGYLYLGSSSWISAHVPFKRADVVHNFGSFPSPLPGRYLILSEQQGAGNCLAWIKDKIFHERPEMNHAEKSASAYRFMDQLVEKAPAGANRLIFTPWLYGERTPVDDCWIRASLFNLSLENNREDILRAVFEGVAFNSRWLLEPMEKFIGRPFAYLNFIGGGANSDIWAQIFADVLNRKIRQLKEPLYANARGAAFLAAVALRELKPEEIPRYIQVKKEYQPDPVHRERYDKIFGEFVRLYRAQRKACMRMNRQKILNVV